MDTKELSLVELIDVDTLQRIQDAFSDLTGMAAITTERDGTPVTKASKITNFCSCVRSSTLGNMLCRKCDKLGTQLSMENGQSCSYICHAGLVEFSAPIMANGTMIGCFIGGQVLTSPPKMKEFRQISEQLGINRKDYDKMVKSIQVVSQETVDNAASFLHIIADTLSGIAYNAYKLKLSNIEVEKAARAKSDFLANMSHEIRTPMNAVLGMAELALREDMPSSVREYLHQMRSSAKNLLVIINDILDFSKIESGKMDIIPVTYEPLSMINDLASIISSRIGSKDIQFIMDIDPRLPAKLYGDNVRIQQILINILNNAVKFTKEGRVMLRLECEAISDGEIILKADVTDTGSGIKQEDMGKLFQSFQQVDSKRNRNIEGTGLGLAITQKLLDLMGGSIKVESEYNKGSTFSFTIPQKAESPLAELPELEPDTAIGLIIENRYVKEQIVKDLDRINAKYSDFDSGEKYDFIICERKFFTHDIEALFENDGSLRGIVLDEFSSPNDLGIVTRGVHVLRKPVYYTNLYAALGIAEEYKREEADALEEFTFIAPDARVLVVDDNSINLTVAKGLLEPLKMQVDTAVSAAQTIEMVKEKLYDVIFMDHMMPEVDGIEATHIIRRMIKDYENVPIIALTANAVGGVREMFIKEGLNDFVAKPIDTKIITAKLKKWLPPEKIIFTEQEERKPELDSEPETEEKLVIEGIDAETAMPLLGSRSLYMTVLKEYYLKIDKKAVIIENYWNRKMIDDYTIEVHALKSTSRQIGAFELGSMAEDMENAGKSGNTELIDLRTEAMLEKYRSLKSVLEPYFPECKVERSKKTVEPVEISLALDEFKKALDEFDSLAIDEFKKALDEFDSLAIDEAIEKISEFRLDGSYSQYFEELKLAAEESDVDRCDEIFSEWKSDIAQSYINR